MRRTIRLPGARRGMVEFMKTISIVVPTYNEEENVIPLAAALISELEEHCVGYSYEIIFIDNDSKDSTRDKIRTLCADNPRIKAIFNAKNFGQLNSPYYGLLQSTGDCTILICADFQDPVEMISIFVHEWEQGYKVVIGEKISSQENPLMYWLRSCYYKLIKTFSDVEQIEHFTGFGLYDREFIDILKNLNDSTPFLRGIVAELGYKMKIIPYEQRLRRGGKSKNNFMSLYDVAMRGFTSYTKIGLRAATFVGFGVALISLAIAVFYLIYKLMFWNSFSVGMAPMLIGMFFLGSVQLIFLGLMGEYILSINQRSMNRPLVIEEERINFGKENPPIVDS